MLYLKDLRYEPEIGIYVSPGTIDYRDTSEEYLKEIFKKVSDLSSSSTELAQYIKDWPTKYHLSPKRANLLRGLDFLKNYKNRKVLELGSGCGSITRWLGENFKKVDAVEGSLVRTCVAKERCRDLKSVNFFCANIQDLSFEADYDMVTLIGVLEYAPMFFDKKYTREEACILMLKKALSALKPKGILVIGIENKLGLKYWAGFKEDHSGRFFDGIYGYPSENSAVTFSKKELISLLKMAGFEFIEFFYPFPDYKLCSTVIRDAENIEQYYVHNWLNFPFEDNTGRKHIFHEGLALKNIVSCGLLDEFANSFLVVASPQKRRPYKKPEWIVKKIVNHNHWSKNFHYIVSLCRTKNGLKVKRESECEYYESDKLIFSLKRESDFVPGDLLIFSAWKAIFSNDPISNLLQVLHKLKEFLMSRFYTGETDQQGYPLLKGEAIDCTLWNLIENQDQMHFIDNKWTWKRPVSIDFVLFRNLFHFVNKSFPFLGTEEYQQNEWIFNIIKKFYPYYSLSRHESNFEQEKEFQRHVHMGFGVASQNKVRSSITTSIIIPVFNKLEYTRQCIEALFKVTPVSLFELIVINNASTDGTKEYLDRLCTQVDNVKVIHNDTNVGFAKACNQGARVAKGKYLLFLNNDTVPLKGWLEEMIKVVETEENVGVVGSKLLFPDNTIQHAGVEVTDWPLPVSPYHIYYRWSSDSAKVNVKRDYPAVTGACMLTPKWLFEELAGFDEGFLNGYEDVDYCFRVRKKGLRVVYTPKSVLYHYESVTEGRFKAVKENEKRLIDKWKGKIEVKHSPKIGIVILNYNGANDTVECLDSIYRNINYKRFQVILVDNGSREDDLRIIEEWKKQSGYEFVLIKNSENLGFAGGNNVGIKKALESGADFIWLLNNDLVVEKNALESSLLAIGKSHLNIGMVSSKIYCYSNRSMVQYNGEKVCYKGFPDKEDDGLKFVDFAPACSVLISKEVFKKIGLLNEDYFLYYEDNDFCKRLKKAGFQILYNPFSKVYHKGGASIGSWLRSPVSAYYATRNFLYCFGDESQEMLLECLTHLTKSYWKDLKKEPGCVKGFVEGIKDYMLRKKGKVKPEQLDIGFWNNWPSNKYRKIAKELVFSPDKNKFLKFLSFSRNLLLKSMHKLKKELRNKAYMLCEKGEEEYAKGNVEKAILLFEEAIRLDDRCHVAYNNLAAIYWQMQDVEMAHYFINRAMKLAPKDPDVLWNYNHIKKVVNG